MAAAEAAAAAAAGEVPVQPSSVVLFYTLSRQKQGLCWMETSREDCAILG